MNLVKFCRKEKKTMGSKGCEIVGMNVDEVIKLMVVCWSALI